MITIYGRRGIGKSSLGAKLVEALSDMDGGFTGIVNLSTRIDGPITVERIFFGCLELAPPERHDTLRALWAGQRPLRDKLADLFAGLGTGPCLLVLDNLEDQLSPDGVPVDEEVPLFFDVVFRGGHAPRVLVTSQIPPSFDPAMRRFEVRLHLDQGLPVGDSVALLRELDRDGEAGLVDAPWEDLEYAVEKLHGVPRALELVVGAIVDDHLTLPTMRDIVADFAVRGDVVDQLAQRNLRHLGAEERLVLDVLAVFRSPVERAAVEWVMRPLFPALDPGRALARLARVYMISVDRRSRTYMLHPLDGDLVYGALSPNGPWSRRVLERRVAGWYARHRHPGPWKTVTDVLNHRHEFDHRVKAGDYDAAALVLDEIDEFLIWQGSIREVVGMHLAIEGKLTDDSARLAHLVGLGLAWHVGGPAERAIPLFLQAEAIAERLRDRRQLVRALFSLGDIYRQSRRLREAVDTLRRAAEEAEGLEDTYRYSHSLLCLSLSHTYLGEVEEALEVADRLRVLADTTGDPMVRARFGDAGGSAYVVAQRWGEAIEAAHMSIDAYSAAGVPEALGYARNVEGISLLGLGRIDEALGVFARARTDGVGVETPRVEGLCLYNAAWGHWMNERYGEARDSALDAVAAFRRSVSVDATAAQALHEAAGAMANGEHVRAAERLREAASLSDGNSDLVPSAWLTGEATTLEGELP